MSRLMTLLPGLLLSAAIGGVAMALHAAEARFFAHPPLESLVLALLLGVAFRQIFGCPPRCLPGQSYGAKQVLEAAVLLLGATMDLRQLMAGGPRLLLAVAILVSGSLAGGAFIGRRLFRLDRKPALLLAVGNSICGTEFDGGAFACFIVAMPPKDVRHDGLVKVVYRAGAALVFCWVGPSRIGRPVVNPKAFASNSSHPIARLGYQL